MPAAIPQGARFLFAGSRGSFSGGVTRIEVETPSAEIVDATGILDATNAVVLVPTGAWKGGSIKVDYIRQRDSQDIQLLVRSAGQLGFTATGFSYSRRVILESASEVASAGDVVRGTMRFVMTDWYGN